MSNLEKLIKEEAKVADLIKCKGSPANYVVS